MDAVESLTGTDGRGQTQPRAALAETGASPCLQAQRLDQPNEARQDEQQLRRPPHRAPALPQFFSPTPLLQYISSLRTCETILLCSPMQNLALLLSLSCDHDQVATYSTTRRHRRY